MAPASPAPVRRSTWTVWTFRVVTTVVAILMFGQALLAGQFLSGVYGALLSHRDMSTVTVAAVALSIVAAVLLRVRGQRSWWPIVATVLVFALTALQTFAGYRALLGLHVPLGVAVIMMATALAVWAWWKR